MLLKLIIIKKIPLLILAMYEKQQRWGYAAPSCINQPSRPPPHTHTQFFSGLPGTWGGLKLKKPCTLWGLAEYLWSSSNKRLNRMDEGAQGSNVVCSKQIIQVRRYLQGPMHCAACVFTCHREKMKSHKRGKMFMASFLFGLAVQSTRSLHSNRR